MGWLVGWLAGWWVGWVGLGWVGWIDGKPFSVSDTLFPGLLPGPGLPRLTATTKTKTKTKTNVRRGCEESVLFVYLFFS